MPTSFRAPFQVLRRNLGEWINGVYVLNEDTGTFITVMATVQQPSVGDRQVIEATEWGKRASRYIKIYVDPDQRLQCVNQSIEGMRGTYAGDIFYYDGSQYLLFGETDFTMLSRTRRTTVSHWRYYACETIEGFAMEPAP